MDPHPFAVDPPRRVLLTGAVNGNADWMLEHVLPLAVERDCQLILQLGNLGISRDDPAFLEFVEGGLVERRLVLAFLDGNRDDHDYLQSLRIEDDGLSWVCPVIANVSRGQRLRWFDRTLLACGGVVSEDVVGRVPYVDWWPEEAISQADLLRCITGGPADVLLTHDAGLAAAPDPARVAEDLTPRLRDRVRMHRAALDLIVDAVRPSLQVHARYQTPRDQTIPCEGGVVRVVSLSGESQSSSSGGHCAVLDLETLQRDPTRAVTVID